MNISDKIKALKDEIEAAKPNDRTPRDRACQIILTDLEKVIAYAAMYTDSAPDQNDE